MKPTKMFGISSGEWNAISILALARKFIILNIEATAALTSFGFCGNRARGRLLAHAREG
jgi:hypothetical protein